MATYEYKRESTVSGHLPMETMNKLGADGWDNYAVQGNIYFFKRVVEAKEYAGEKNVGALKPKTGKR